MDKLCERTVVGVVFLYLVLLLICIYQCYLTVEYRTELKPYKYASSVLIQDSVSTIHIRKVTDASVSERLDSISLCHAIRMDSLSNALSKMEHDFINHQENTLNDFRQETNNIINKLNGWFSFWIAILAILGGLLPLIIQYVQYKRTEFNLHESMKNYQNSLSITKNNVKIQIQKCNDKLEELNYQGLQMEICSIISCIMTIRNVRMINGTLHSVQYYNRLLYRLYGKFVALYGIVRKNDFNEEGLEQLELTLIQIQAVYIHISLNLENRTNSRRMQVVIDEIQNVVCSIINGKMSKEEIIRDIIRLKDNLLVTI